MPTTFAVVLSHCKPLALDHTCPCPRSDPSKMPRATPEEPCRPPLLPAAEPTPAPRPCNPSTTSSTLREYRYGQPLCLWAPVAAGAAAAASRAVNKTAGGRQSLRPSSLRQSPTGRNHNECNAQTYRQVPNYYTLPNLSIYIYPVPKWFERVHFRVTNS